MTSMDGTKTTTSAEKYKSTIDGFECAIVEMTTTSQAFCHFASLGCIDLNKLHASFKKLGVDSYTHGTIPTLDDKDPGIEFTFTFKSDSDAHDFINGNPRQAFDAAINGIVKDNTPAIKGKLDELAQSIDHKVVPNNQGHKIAPKNP